jgi:hypothetical protein
MNFLTTYQRFRDIARSYRKIVLKKLPDRTNLHKSCKANTVTYLPSKVHKSSPVRISFSFTGLVPSKKNKIKDSKRNPRKIRRILRMLTTQLTKAG